ncbi:MAG: 7-cyano-7-deazaguanine synthase QueC [Ignavibacteria bacterium]|nr:7-cyano-7-deazaguanine synthase QueC [Ignavibacteria bacterium]
MHKKDIAIVLVSGGMDSALTTAYAFEKYELAFLHFNYGQRTEKRELKAFNDLADYYKVRYRKVINLNYFKQIGGSSLTDRNIEVSKADLKSKRIPTSYVPFRNANFLAVAVSWAEVLGAKRIYIGAVEEDSSGYPDTREEFFKNFNQLIKFGTKISSELKIVTPIIHFSKKDIVINSIKKKVPLHLTWSCYKNSNIACGECDSCAFRLRGFQQAGIEDPIKYKVIKNYNL